MYFFDDEVITASGQRPWDVSWSRFGSFFMRRFDPILGSEDVLDHRA